jgi:hypothetical protein
LNRRGQLGDLGIDGIKMDCKSFGEGFWIFMSTVSRSSIFENQ